MYCKRVESAWKKDHARYIIRNKSSAVAEMGDHLATIEMSQKAGGGCCAPFLGGAGSPSNTMSPGLSSIPNCILIHPTVWPQDTNVTDRQRSDNIGRTILQTVAQKEKRKNQNTNILKQECNGTDGIMTGSMSTMDRDCS